MLRRAAQLVHRHMAAGRLLQGEPTDECRSLLPLGGRLCQGLRARPHFMAREEMGLQLPHLAAHCQEMWLKGLRAPARLRPAIGERFFMSYFLRPAGGGQALPPYAQHPQRAPV